MTTLVPQTDVGASELGNGKHPPTLPLPHPLPAPAPGNPFLQVPLWPSASPLLDQIAQRQRQRHEAAVAAAAAAAPGSLPAMAAAADLHGLELQPAAADGVERLALVDSAGWDNLGVWDDGSLSSLLTAGLADEADTDPLLLSLDIPDDLPLAVGSPGQELHRHQGPTGPLANASLGGLEAAPRQPLPQAVEADPAKLAGLPSTILGLLGLPQAPLAGAAAAAQRPAPPPRVADLQPAVVAAAAQPAALGPALPTPHQGRSGQQETVSSCGASQPLSSAESPTAGATATTCAPAAQSWRQRMSGAEQRAARAASQRRYIQRKKERLQELEEQVAEMEQRLAQVRLANQVAQRQEDSYWMLLGYRNEMVATLKDAREADPIIPPVIMGYIRAWGAHPPEALLRYAVDGRTGNMDERGLVCQAPPFEWVMSDYRGIVDQWRVLLKAAEAQGQALVEAEEKMGGQGSLDHALSLQLCPLGPALLPLELNPPPFKAPAEEVAPAVGETSGGVEQPSWASSGGSADSVSFDGQPEPGLPQETEPGEEPASEVSVNREQQWRQQARWEQQQLVWQREAERWQLQEELRQREEVEQWQQQAEEWEQQSKKWQQQEERWLQQSSSENTVQTRSLIDAETVEGGVSSGALVPAGTSGGSGEGGSSLELQTRRFLGAARLHSMGLHAFRDEGLVVKMGGKAYLFSRGNLQTASYLVQRLGALTWQQGTLFPQNLMKVCVSRMDTGEYCPDSTPEDAAHWDRVVERLHLRPDQLKLIVQCHGECREALEAAGARRKQVTDTLLQLQAQLGRVMATGQAQETSRISLATRDCVDELERCAADERAAEFRLALVFMRTMDFPVQTAALLVGCWPFFPRATELSIRAAALLKKLQEGGEGAPSTA